MAQLKVQQAKEAEEKNKRKLQLEIQRQSLESEERIQRAQDEYELSALEAKLYEEYLADEMLKSADSSETEDEFEDTTDQIPNPNDNSAPDERLVPNHSDTQPATAATAGQPGRQV